MQKIMFFILVGMIITPQITFGSWWNPVSWIKINESGPQIKNNTAISTTTIEEIKESKPITQIVEVDNPKLKSQIEALVNENRLLRSKIEGLSLEVKECKATFQISKEKLKREEKFKEIDNLIIPFVDKLLSSTLDLNKGVQTEVILLNSYLDGYRIIDSNMTYKIDLKLTEENPRLEYLKLKKYLDMYLKYRE